MKYIPLLVLSVQVGDAKDHRDVSTAGIFLCFWQVLEMERI